MTQNNMLGYVRELSESGARNWFSHPQQKVAGLALCYEIAKAHAPTMSPKEVVEYVQELNDEIFEKLLKGPSC